MEQSGASTEQSGTSNESGTAQSSVSEAYPSDIDSVDFSLLTCAPGHEQYTIFGHTAIRMNDKRQNGRDLAFNYGIFSFKKKFFVLRFIMGLTDYELAAWPTSIFLKDYKEEGRQVIEQPLNLTALEKARLMAALFENCREENKTYRYNFFYKNCTTKARDIIASCLEGKIDYHWKENETTFREMVHQYNASMPWTRFGEDILLGVAADRKIDNTQQQFAPITLENDFNNADILNPDGSTRPLAATAKQLSPSGITITSGGFPLTPNECGLLLLLFTAVLTFVEWKRRKVFWLLDAIYLLAVGGTGIILAMMIFSEHPTVSLNMNILLLNPIPLFFIPMTIMRGRKKINNPFWKYEAVALLLYLLVAAPFIQNVPGALIFVALSLLIRCGASLALSGRLKTGK